MKLKQTAIILTLTLALGLTGCSLFKKSSTASFDSGDAIPLYPVTTVTETDLSIEGHWFIKSVGSIKLHSIEDEEWPYIEFVAAEARFYGHDGCNLINGSYRLGADHSLELSNIASTLRMCEGDSLAYPIANALDATKSFSVSRASDGAMTLTLVGADKRPLMTLGKSDIDYLNGAWQVTAVNGRNINVANARLVIDVNSGRISGNAGCNRLNGEISRNPQVGSSVQFSNLATTRMTCPDIQTESALLIALEEVVTARSGSDDTADLLDSSGHCVVKLSRLTREQLSDNQ
ncbi:MAG: META domain-containing protein [Muribaculaceae bacterium]|nr:META domain-containing protein [Muribaculaceae bacterium]